MSKQIAAPVPNSRGSREDNYFHSLLDDILDTAIEVTSADMGNIQLLEDGVLRMAAHRGFDAAFLQFFDSVTEDIGACGAALQRGQRVIVEDVASSPLFSGTPERDVLLNANVRAVQSTPITDGVGKLLGVFSTHFYEPHLPDHRELRLLDLLARQAAASIERNRFRSALYDSERRLVEVITRIADGFVILDADWCFTFVNDQASRLTQKTPAEPMGQMVWEIFPELVGGPAYLNVHRAVAEHIDVEFEDFYPPLQRWFGGRAYPTPDGGLAIYFRDITERKQADAALAAKERQLRHVTDSATIMVSQCGRDLRYVFVNKTCAEFLGRPNVC
jgi:PAS domain-containing protein